MKKNLTLAIIFSAFSLALLAQAPDSWAQKADYGDSASISTVAFTIGNLAYFGTGYNAITCTNDFWQYDPSADTWTPKAPVPNGNRTGAIAFSINGKGYVGLGSDCNFNNKNDLWEYDPTVDTWTQKSSFGTGKRWAVVFTLGGKAYVTGGYDGSVVYKDLWCYNPATDTWTQKADFAGEARSNAVAFGIGGKGYVGTGYNDTTNLLDFWAYDTLANAWSPIANYQGTTVIGAMAFAAGNKGYVGGGSTTAGNAVRDFYAYDPVANAWAQVAGLPTARSYASACAVNGAGYVVSGQDSVSDYTKSVFQYTPVVTTGIAKPGDWQVSVWPNPFKGQVILKNLPATGTTDISVYNILGEKLLEQNTNAVNLTLNLTSLPASGVYLVKLNCAGKEPVTFKLVKD